MNVSLNQTKPMSQNQKSNQPQLTKSILGNLISIFLNLYNSFTRIFYSLEIKTRVQKQCKNKDLIWYFEEEKWLLVLPDDPDDEANDWDDEGKKSKGKTQEKTQGSAITIWVAHIDFFVLCFLFPLLWERRTERLMVVLLRREERRTRARVWCLQVKAI